MKIIQRVMQLWLEKNKYEPTSAPLVKSKRMFRQSSFCKNENADAWIITLEKFRMKLENLGTAMTDDQFQINLLNNLTNHYELQTVRLEKRIGNKENTLEVNELREAINQKNLRLSMQSGSINESIVNEEQDIITEKFKGKCLNCGEIGHKSVHCNGR
jgi:hypothetical protein